ncbi:Aldo/keto reductase [Amniculicola lignicola CBS 123094]|uniref:Aldo/keto reductase n=1 Tax=Amniculicola lignicola CBS 123094 TaxID=1392246 RepID=A0A6A5WGK7_9PLEO|nr:Aldo/keto reductase [Amniculicola lignicola CBS 123094]
MLIHLILGAGNWGQGATDSTPEFKAAVLKHKDLIKTIDTAALYPLPAPGASEKVIGELGYARERFDVNTKALFRMEGGCYNAKDVEESVVKSLGSLEVKKVNVLYAHAPDRKTPVAEQARAFHEQFLKERIAALGVANLDAGMLGEWIKVADEEGLVKPTVYQGQYNILCRAHEDSVMPIVRQNGMTFMAYSPLAGGFLSGIATFSSAPNLIGTRFEHTDNNMKFGPFYKYWYDKPSMHEAVKILKSKSEEFGIDLADIAIRWLVNHSELKDGDGVIVGPDTVEELEKCVDAYKAGPLPGGLVEAIERLQVIVREDAKVVVQF